MNREKIKLLVIGCPKSGKSSLIHRYNSNEYSPDQISTDLVIKTMTFNDNDISVHIWELQEKQGDNVSFFEGTDGIVLVSDITSIDSVVGLNLLYINAKKHLGITDDTYPVVVVANKIDLKDADTIVTQNGLLRWVSSIWPNVPSNLFFVESSAKENIKVREVFDHVVQYIYHSSKNKAETPVKTTNSTLMNSFYGNPLNIRRGSAIKVTESNFSPSNDLSHIQQQRQQQAFQTPPSLNHVVRTPTQPPAFVHEDHHNYDDDTTVNIVIAGSCYAGKTSVLSNFMGDTNIFKPVESHLHHLPPHHGNHHHNVRASHKRTLYHYEPTIGVDFRTYYEMLIDDMNLKLQIWDSSGNPAMRNVARTIYRDADGLILMYDITSEDSFLALDGYLQDYLTCRDSQEEFVALLVGNKCDQSDRRAVTMDRVIQWCSDRRPYKPITYVECSALTGTGIKDIFLLASEEVCDYLFEDDDEYTDTDYDDTHDDGSESDEDCVTNYTDLSMNDEDFTPVFHKMNTASLPMHDNFNAASSEVTGASELTMLRKRPRNRKKPSYRPSETSSQAESIDHTSVINNQHPTEVRVSQSNVKASEHLDNNIPETHKSSTVVRTSRRDTVTEEEVIESVDSSSSKRIVKKSKSEINDEVILQTIGKTVKSDKSPPEQSCWTGILDTLTCIVMPPPEHPVV